MHLHMHSPAMFWPECDKPSCAGRSPKHDSFSRSDRRGQTYVRILEAGLGGCRLTWIGSVDGGLEELDEFRLSRASRAAIRRSNESTRLRMAALASAGILTQRSSGRGGLALMPSDVTERDRWRKSLLTVKAYPKSGVRR